ncbi:alpha/beta hydrolase [Treponema sp.]|uniref:alpha/beta hydrolase n=1 Tax=Treponema sp. TaxID=166 RepID=UPI0025EFC7F1|nr:alpha/beta hydrolase [Treponema sp.]MCR5218705.1 alpha/beta hydrolase [Treponema sp.]
MSEFVEKIRREWGANDAKRDAAFKTPQDIIRFDDILYEKDKIFNKLDVYRPKNIPQNKKIPVILNVHGGGWVYGTKETYQFYGMELARQGFAVVNFTYRLAPESKYPASIEDTNSVVKWIFANKDVYGFDLNNFFATGDSAGAHLLSIYTAALSDKSFADRFNFDLVKDFNFKAIVLNCGKYSFKEEVYSDQDLLKEILAEDTPQNRDMLETVEHISPAYPPVYIMTCTGDFLREQSVLLASALTEKSVPFEYHYVKDAKINLWHCYQNNIDLDAAKQCHQDECNFFKKFTGEVK